MSYYPGTISGVDSPEEIIRYLSEELLRIKEAFESLQVGYINFQVLHVAPTRPRSGDVYYADGTDWNPGSGEGLYRYSSGGSYVHLG